MNRRVFFITGIDIAVFEWHGRRLYASCHFGDSEAEVARFKDYLRSVAPMTSQLLVDLLDEEFLHEKIPHLYGRERDSYIKRQLLRHCRDAKFTCARIIGREASGRRDDQLLITSIASSDALDAWLKLLVEFAVPIAGIWSLPLLSESLVDKLKLQDSNLFLVSRQVDSVMRESFFKNKRLHLSRHVKTDRDASEFDDAAAYLSQGLEQIYKFLSNQRVIPFGQKVNVVCLLPEKHLADAQALNPNTDTLQYQFYSLESLYKRYKVHTNTPGRADILFSFICAQQPVHKDHYSTNSHKRSFYRFILDKVTFLMGNFGSLTAITMAALIYVAGLDILAQIQTLEDSATRLQYQYRQRYSALEGQIQTADLMRESVGFHKILLAEAQLSPELFLAPLGSILKQKPFSFISLESLFWNKYYGTELERIRRDIWQKTTPNLTVYAEYPYNEEELDDIVPVIVLIGHVNRQTLSYRATVETMQDFVHALQSLNDVEQLMVVRTPVDIRITSRFSDQNGSDSTEKAANSDADQFEIMLLLKPSQPTLQPTLPDQGAGDD